MILLTKLISFNFANTHKFAILAWTIALASDPGSIQGFQLTLCSNFWPDPGFAQFQI